MFCFGEYMLHVVHIWEQSGRKKLCPEILLNRLEILLIDMLKVY